VFEKAIAVLTDFSFLSSFCIQKQEMHLQTCFDKYVITPENKIHKGLTAWGGEKGRLGRSEM
jgi:hypothetical protein